MFLFVPVVGCRCLGRGVLGDRATLPVVVVALLVPLVIARRQLEEAGIEVLGVFSVVVGDRPSIAVDHRLEVDSVPFPFLPRPVLLREGVELLARASALRQQARRVQLGVGKVLHHLRLAGALAEEETLHRPPHLWRHEADARDVRQRLQPLLVLHHLVSQGLVVLPLDCPCPRGRCLRRSAPIAILVVPAVSRVARAVAPRALFRGMRRIKTKIKKTIGGDGGGLFLSRRRRLFFSFIFIFISIYTRADIRYAHEF